MNEIVSLNGVDLSWISDLAHLEIASTSLVPGQDSLTARVQRVRGGLSAAFNIPLNSHVDLAPFATLNLRYDGGTDQEGSGLEALGGARLSVGAFEV